MDIRKKQRLSTVINLEDLEDEFARSPSPEIVVPKNGQYSHDPEWEPGTTSSKPKSKPGVVGKRSRDKSVVISFSKKMKVKSTQSSEKATSKRAAVLNSKLKYLSNSDDENDASADYLISPRTRTYVRIDFEKFVESGGNLEDFWLLPNVKKRLSKIQTQVEYFEKQACSNFLDANDIPWEEMMKISRSLKVTPEMISAHFGKNVLTERRLRKGKLMIAPSGEVIPLKPKYSIYIENEVGTEDEFWDQDYVKIVVSEVQNAKKSQIDGAEQLGVTIDQLSVEIDRKNDRDKLSAIERIRQNNIAQRMKLFHELNIKNLKSDYISKFHTRKNPPKNDEELKTRPKSARIQKRNLKRKEEHEEFQNLLELPQLPNVEFLKFDDCMSLMQNREKFGETLESISQSVVDEVKVQKPIIGLSAVERLDVIAMAQLTEGHIWAVDMVHDGEKYLIGCGSENGEIGLWRPGLDKPVRMRIHNKSITDLKFQKSSLSKIWTVSDDKFAKVVDLQAQVVESVGELDEEIFWIEELTDRNSWLLGTPNVINLCDDRMKNITNLIPKTNGVKSVLKNDLLVVPEENSVKIFDLRFLKTRKPAISPTSIFEKQFDGNMEPIRLCSHPFNNKLAVVVKNLSEETKTYIYEVCSEKGLDNDREFDATTIYTKGIDIIGQTCSKFQIGTFESMAWHPNEENVLFVSNSLEDRHGHAQVYFQARNVDDSQSFVNYKYFHRPKLSVDNKLAIVADKFEETKTYIYELSNDKGLDNEKVFDATSINMKEYGLYGTTGTRLPMFGKNVDGILESIAWHPNEENVLFVSCSLEGRSNHVYFQAKNVEDSETLFDYKYFDRPKLAIETFGRHPFMLITNGLCAGSCSVMASEDFLMP